MHLFLYFIFTLLMLSQQACGQTTDKAYKLMLEGLYKNTVPSISAVNVYKQLQQKEPVVLLDTRTYAEYKVSHLPGSQFVDYDSFNVGKLERIPKNARVIVYCSVGYRSERVGEQLRAAGYRQVYNLYGGIFEWVNQSYPVYNSSGLTNKVHAYSKVWGMWLQEGEKVYD
ncbi:rhodanese-like domain-containing protein [Pontibacter vulgaris]|uniref:rhodanese-like domain-containing protein n=1 Tax=Pontibacter vulgaris TaxID=2905679 RepID=UPI001FA7196F|nr:rhodanese-like domain-containing protein [Pontibacter vulgaris]